MKIILIGYMGSGKSLVGNYLSSITNLNFIDLDTYIETQENLSISALFDTKGEIYFRKKETKYLEDVIAINEPAIIATGGGTPCYGTIMEILNANNDVVTVYLAASVDELTNRLFPEKSKRPLIAHIETEALLNDFIRKHLFERSFYYNKAKLKVEVDGASPKEIAEKIIINLF